MADEELNLLCKLRQLLPSHRHHLSFLLLTRNEILKVARETLSVDEWTAFYEFADQLALSIDNDGIVGCLRDIEGPSEAELLADFFLREGSGSLWSAAREVARCLTFEDDSRDARMV